MKKLLTFLIIVNIVFIYAFSTQVSYADDDLVAHWKLDEGSGTTAIDSSGNGHDGTLVNVTYSSTVPDVEFTNPYSAYFNPSVPGRVITTNLSLNEYTQFTLTGWAYPTAATARAGWFGQNDVFEFGFNSGNFLTCYTTRGEVNYEYDPATFLNQWHHIACLATETHLIVYIDGVNVGSDILDDAETFGSSGDNFTIGAGVMDGGTQHPFSGYIDDVRVYSRGLTPTEMENLGSGMEEPEAPEEPEETEDLDDSNDSEIPKEQTHLSQSNNGNRRSSASARACGDIPPTGVPDLFQIDVSSTQAVLYYTPNPGQVSNHMITYGYTSGDNRFGIQYSQGSSTGVQSYTISDLSPNTTYYFKVRAGNGCMPGEWSNEMKITTAKSSEGVISYYKSFVQKLLTYLPLSY